MIYVHRAEARRRFKELAEGEIGEGDLIHAALLIALEDYPELDIGGYMAQIDSYAERIRKRSSPGEPPIFRLGHLQAVLFDEEGFTGDVETYHDIRNTYINEALERKKGLPITLSMIVLHVARKIGLDAAGVGLPGHFIVKVGFELNEVYVDPFNSGTTLTLPEIGEIVQQATRGPLRPEHLRRWDARAILIRALTNMQNFHTRSGNARKALAARERIELLRRVEN